MVGIYKIQSSINPNRIYIGSSINILGRWYIHTWKLKNKKHENSKLQNHYNKYGIEDLQFSILLYGCAKEDILKIEQVFLNTYKPYFNICKVANNRLGVKVSEETKKKMSKAKKGIKRSLNSTIKRKPHSAETKEKMRLAKIGKKRTEEAKEKLRKPKSSVAKMNMKKPKSEKHKINISNSMKGKIPWNKGKHKK